MKKTIIIIIKILLTALAVVFTFFNLIAGVAFLNGNNVRMGIELITLTVIGYDIAVLLVWLKKEIAAAVLSFASSIVLLMMKNDFEALKLIGNNSAQLYKTRHLPSIAITAVILIFAIVKLVKIIKSIRRKKALENRKKAPSILS